MRGLAVAIVVALTAVRPVAAQEDCRQLIEEARRAYGEGNFDRVLVLTSGCVADRVAREDAIGLRARTLLALDRIDEAQQAVTALVRLNPQFSSNSDDSRRFIALVAVVKRELGRNATSSVSKMNESLLEAPATVAVITADQIERRGYLDLEAVLHDLPGFDIARTNGQNYSNIYQRGYKADATNRTLFIVDGVEQNDLHSNIAHISRQYSLSNIERIEVVYGPASTMYGANAFLGVINVITKEPEDFIAAGKQVGGNLQLGGGAFGTRYIDGNVAVRFRDATFSLTGRVYRSDEWDLSRFPQWTYDPAFFASAEARQRYKVVLPGFSATEFLFFDPTELGITIAGDTDAAAYGESINGTKPQYSDLTDDWMLSGKLKTSNFLVGFQAWKQREGAAASGTFRKEPGARNGNVWVPQQVTAFARYNVALSGSFAFSYLGQAKVHRLGQGSASFTFDGYLDGPFNVVDLAAEVRKQPFWRHTLLEQSSSQFRNELNLVYRFKDKLSVVAGGDFRNGLVQSDYARSSNCVVEASPFAGLTPADAGGLVDAVGNFASGSLVYLSAYFDRLFSFLVPNPLATPRCTPKSDRTPAPVTSAGEHFTVRDIGLFGQASYKPIAGLKLVGGLRMDHDHIDPVGGFGMVGTPRLGAVYSSRGYVFKAIYSGAFKDPSSLERYSTIPGIRDVPSPQLRPERVSNIEMAAGHQWPNFVVDTSVFRSKYSDPIGLRGLNLADDPRMQALVAREFGLRGEFVANRLSRADYMAELTNLFSTLSQEQFDDFFSSPLVTRRYTNAGAMRVWGFQASATGQFRETEVFGNYTYENPWNVDPRDQFGEPLTDPSGQRITRLRLADIPSHHLNLGVSNRWGKVDGTLRLNYVGVRPTGEGTTLNDKPASELDSHAVWHGTIGYRLRTGLTAQLIVNNIFNAQYSDPGVGIADGIRFAASVPQPGRSVFVRMLARF
jgi:outer membrane receptor protein involved in Fe transport